MTTPTTPLTPAEYCDAATFPLTTQKGLRLEEQMMIDAINLDEYREDLEQGKKMNAREQALGAELEDKYARKPVPTKAPKPTPSPPPGT